ncbi:MAG: SDR family oxidoreductase [Syntrophobacteraceae bacterium]
MATILITGGTGTIGSPLTAALKRAGHKLVFLVRAGTLEAGAKRVASSLDLDREDILLLGDVTLPGCGVRPKDGLSGLQGKVDKMFHCAASINFEPKSTDEVRTTNIRGTKNALELATWLGVPEFHHCSTLYIAGNADVFREDDFNVGQSFRNAYEFSKFEAERLVRSAWGGKYTIYRLGIVVGDSLTGRISSFHGFYRAFLGFWELYKFLLARWKEDKLSYKEHGVFFDSQEVCHLPMRIQVSPSAPLSLTPVDWVISQLTCLMEENAANKVHHISPSNPPLTKWLVAASLETLKFKDFILTGEEFEPRNDFIGKLEKKIRRDIRLYQPYIMHEAEFHREQENGSRYDFSPDLLMRLLNYAKSRNFGRKSGKETGGLPS